MSILQHLLSRVDIGSGHSAVDGNFQRKAHQINPSWGGAIALTAGSIFVVLL